MNAVWPGFQSRPLVLDVKHINSSLKNQLQLIRPQPGFNYEEEEPIPSAPLEAQV
jgi:hypothetical protein